MKSILSYCSFLIALCGYTQDWQQVGSGIDGKAAIGYIRLIGSVNNAQPVRQGESIV